MKQYVNVKELIDEVDAMAERGTLLARGGVTQDDLAMQIKGLIIHAASNNKMNKVDEVIYEETQRVAHEEQDEWLDYKIHKAVL